MAETWFSDNYGDLSVQTGTNAGFQFEFYCERCRDAYRTEFEPYRKAQAAGWLGKASGFLGGALGQADDAVDALANAGWKTGWDNAFRKSVSEATAHFHRCAKCFQYVCDRCFNTDLGLCLNCAPDAEVEITAARAQGVVQGAVEVGTAAGYAEGKKIDVKRDRQLVCPDCGAETKGAKFCPECGKKLAVPGVCVACGAETSPTAKFCPECGEKMPQ